MELLIDPRKSRFFSCYEKKRVKRVILYIQLVIIILK